MTNRKIPRWIRELSPIYKKGDNYEHALIHDLKEINDFSFVLKVIEYWEIKGPFPFKFWKYVNENSDAVLELALDKDSWIAEYLTIFLKEFDHVYDRRAVAMKLDRNDEEGNYWPLEEDIDRSDIAAFYGEIGYLQNLEKSELNEKIMDYIGAMPNSLNSLIYLHEEHDFPLTEHTISNAVSSGNMECLKYCHENNCPFFSYIYNHTYHFNVIKYLHENDYPWSESFLSSLALTDSEEEYNLIFEIMEYALSHDYECTPNDFYSFVKHGKYKELRYLYDNECPFDLDEALKKTTIISNKEDEKKRDFLLCLKLKEKFKI